MKRRLILIAALCVAILYLITTWRESRVDKAALLRANEAYLAAVQSTDVYGRKEAFNHALNLFSTLEKSYQPRFGNGALYRVIGNIYFELNSYPFALLYYYKAKQLKPTDRELDLSIQKTREKLMLPLLDKHSFFYDLFFFHNKLALPVRLQLVFLLALACGILLFIDVSRTSRALFVLIPALLIMTVSVLYTRYIEPQKAVLIESSMLSHEAFSRQELVGTSPVPKGTKIYILESYGDGRWVKVTTPSGQLGFLPIERLRLI